MEMYAEAIKKCRLFMNLPLAVIQRDILPMAHVQDISKGKYMIMYQDYVDSSADAILTDYNADTDFAFRNDTDATLTIFVYEEDGYLNCDVYQEEEEAGLNW